MRWVWAIRAMFLIAVPVALLENAGTIPTLRGDIATIVLVILLTIHFMVVVRVAKRDARSRSIIRQRRREKHDR